MSTNPYGPLSAAEFQALVEAVETLRKKIKWRVTFTRKVTQTGTAFVEAASEDEADKIASNLADSEIKWGATDDWLGTDDETIESIEAA